MYEIEKGIPKPASKYPFRDMEVGDSILVDWKESGPARDMAYKVGREQNKKFTSAKTEGGIRIWRAE